NFRSGTKYLLTNEYFAHDMKQGIRALLLYSLAHKVLMHSKTPDLVYRGRYWLIIVATFA
ncbi:MAG: hypothetical protein ACXWTT_04580, partial [Methylobacter sp.]